MWGVGGWGGHKSAFEKCWLKLIKAAAEHRETQFASGVLGSGSDQRALVLFYSGIFLV